MADFKKIDDLIDSFLDFDILEDEMPVATTDKDGNVLIMSREEYERYLEAQAEDEGGEDL